MSFAALGLSSPLVRAAAEQGFEVPTPVQAQAIPEVLRGRDVWALSQTGSGKTGAFALPLLDQIVQTRRGAAKRLHGLHTLVLVPTRELAQQVGEVFRALAQGLPGACKVVVAYGGVSINPQMMALRGGADVVVATPGRLLDLVEHNALSLAHLHALVLDEADRLLDLGFADELGHILDLLPSRRQSLFFSATFDDDVQSLAQALLHEPVCLDIEAESTPGPDITQRALEVAPARRTPLLRHLIESEGWERVLVFVATKYATELVAHKLHKAGMAAAALHGDLSQGGRRAVLDAFKARTLRVVVATDVAARGIDIKGLPAVVNYDLPRSAAEYVHRIGRTGRAGESGLAVSFIVPDQEAHFRLIEKRQGMRVEREQLPGFELTPEDRAQSTEALADAGAPKGLDPNGGIKGRRKSKKDKLREAAAQQAHPGRHSG